MTLAAAISSATTSISLAEAVAELLVLARNDAGGRCLWCHSSELQATVIPSRGGEMVVVCRTCGSELRGDVTAVAGRHV